jgi:hypothetical protein
MDESSYPADVSLKLNLVDASQINIDGVTYRCTIHVPRDDEEGIDILILKSDGRSFVVSPWVFYDTLLNKGGRFLTELSSEDIQQIGQKLFVRCYVTDESREYKNIQVSSCDVEVTGKHQTMSFFLFDMKGKCYFIVDELIDSSANRVPRIVSEVRTDRVLFNSAQYNEAEECWEYVEPDNPENEEKHLKVQPFNPRHSDDERQGQLPI